MRALIQRVSKASISPTGSSKDILASIENGMLILVGFEDTDTIILTEQLIQKIKSLRIFSDNQGKMNLAGADVNASYLLVSQFTLFADVKYGNRPSFDKAAPKPKAKELYDHFVKTFERLLGSAKVLHGEFGSDLQVSLVNDGPVTLWLDSKEVL